ncbi:MAG: NusA-like transcription termination signal-binding factor [Candidatus Woesearchaeota archaeon]
MQKIIYNQDVMGFITFFESMTHTGVRDCIEGQQLIFVVDSGNMGRAIGRQGSNVKRLEQALNRKIKIVEFNPLATEFVKNLISPLRADVSEEDGTILLSSNDTRTKSLLIGRNSQNLENYESIVRRYFGDKKLRVG